jgi:hypothetical protein
VILVSAIGHAAPMMDWFFGKVGATGCRPSLRDHVAMIFNI